ncbi:hypothetical protein A7K94_0215135, partial [Modestobacter sp. VKM Ac-2676]
MWSRPLPGTLAQVGHDLDRGRIGAHPLGGIVPADDQDVVQPARRGRQVDLRRDVLQAVQPRVEGAAHRGLGEPHLEVGEDGLVVPHVHPAGADGDPAGEVPQRIRSGRQRGQLRLVAVEPQHREGRTGRQVLRRGEHLRGDALVVRLGGEPHHHQRGAARTNPTATAVRT